MVISFHLNMQHLPLYFLCASLIFSYLSRATKTPTGDSAWGLYLYFIYCHRRLSFSASFRIWLCSFAWMRKTNLRVRFASNFPYLRQLLWLRIYSIGLLLYHHRMLYIPQTGTGSSRRLHTKYEAWLWFGMRARDNVLHVKPENNCQCGDKTTSF